jgi:hypothetical protein
LRRWAVPSLIALLLGMFLVLALIGAGTRGIVAEEVQPYLPQYPKVLESKHGELRAMPPHEPGAQRKPRWVQTSQWPVVSWQSEERIWPVFIRGHQTALATYFGIAAAPLLGGGIAGVRRSSALLGLALVVLTILLSRRLARSSPQASPLRPLLVAALLVFSFEVLSFARTGYAFELGSRVLMMAALVVAAAPSPRRTSTARILAVGLLVAAAILCRATVAAALLPALAVLLWPSERRPGTRDWILGGAIGIGLPIAVVVATQWLIGFRAGTAPMADYPAGQLVTRLSEFRSSYSSSSPGSETRMRSYGR